MKVSDRGLFDVCPNLSSLGLALKSKWTSQFNKEAEDKELRPVLRVGHVERTAVQKTLCLHEVECYGYGMEKKTIVKQRSSPKLLWVSMWQEPALGSGETEPRIQMGEVSASAPQQGLSKQRVVDWAEKNCILCSSAPDVSNKCQQKILRKDKANICSRHRTPTQEWSESQRASDGSKHSSFSLVWS